MNKSLPVLLIMTILSGIALSSTFVSADTEVIDRVELTVPIACTMSGTGTTHTATLNPGTYSAASGSDYEAGIGKTTLTAICNDDNGFSIYAIGYTGNEYGVTNLVGSNTNGTIPTKAYAAGDTTSNWSMKLTKVTNSGSGDPITYNPENLIITTNYDNWIAVPATYTKVAQYKANTGSSTTDTTLGVKLETTYAAYIASNQAADTYVGQVKYTMVHPYNEDAPLFPQQATAGCINYFPNGNNVVGTMGCQSATDGNDIDLLASNFSRTGYGFAGWSDKFDYATNNEAHFYGPQETITVPTGTTANGLSLYAVWIKSTGSLQDSTKVSHLCGTGTGSLTAAPTDGTANLSSVSALTDQRDNETYAIAKLADGKCWMIENLRLDNTAGHNSDGSLAQGYGGQFAGLADAETVWGNNSIIANSLYSTDDRDNIINIGTSNAGYRFPRYNRLNTPQDPANRPQNPTSNWFVNSKTAVGMYSYGNYYTWAAAIADTTAYSTNGQSASNTSICPSGWHLPKGGWSTASLNNDFWQLGLYIMEAAPSNGSYYSSSETNPAGETATAAFRGYPNNFIYSGDVDSLLINDRGRHGYYWSSTTVDDNYAFFLYLNSSSVGPGGGNNNKYSGRTIRCVTFGA